jgi:hypothetical protein
MGISIMQAATGEAVSSERKANSLVPLDTLAATIKASIAAGDKALDKAEQHYKSAGLYLVEARDRLPTERPGLLFTGFIRNVCRMGTARAYELIAIAEGRTTLEEVRAKTNERVKKHRAAPKDDFPLRNGQPAVNTGSSGPTEDDCDDCNNDSERWERSLGNIAGDAISIEAFWTKEFGEEWENFEVPSTAVTLAKQAAKAWTELAASLPPRIDRLGRSRFIGIVSASIVMAFQNLIDTIVVHPTGYKQPYEIDVYGRESAYLGINLFPAGKSVEEILVEEGVSPEHRAAALAANGRGQVQRGNTRQQLHLEPLGRSFHASSGALR